MRDRALPPVRKSLGQHFLSDRRILQRIVDALDPHAGETILEIGPGRGSLTELIAERLVATGGQGKLIAIEYDRALAEMLRARYAGNANVQILQADVLEVALGAAAGGPYALVGNVPYYITTPILFHALRRPRADRAVYLIQREVAERLSARAGEKAYGALSVNVQALATAESVFRVPAGAFTPPPKVESAVVRIVPLATPLIREDEEQSFRELVQASFGMRRKQMRRVVRGLSDQLGLPRLDAAGADVLLGQLGIDPEARPETLAPEEFVALNRRLRASPGS